MGRMIAERRNTRWWRKLNDVIKHAMVHHVPGFGPGKIVLTEHPKSGGTWVSQMLAEYLGMPSPRTRLPTRRRCVVHGHYLYVDNANDTIVLWRDGRDVIVSHYYYHLFHRKTTMPAWAEQQRRQLDIKDPLDIQRYLPRYIEYCCTDGPPFHMTWSSFIETWKNRSGCLKTSYEAMQESPRSEMEKILRYTSEHDIDKVKLEACIAKYSFENVTGRKPGEENKYCFVRKGVVGDWKNHFSRAAREVFDYYAGWALIELGYETDRSWVDN